MPWLDTDGSNFVAAFEQFWNGWASAEGDILLVACGSATSWMTDKLLAHQGGLFNRCATRMFVRPFTLKETEEYLQSKGIEWTRYDIAVCYMIMGGIPFYLKQLMPQWSFSQNIDNIFFREKGLLWDEFEHLYKTLFKQPDNHVAVVEALATKRMGLTRNEIIKDNYGRDEHFWTNSMDNPSRRVWAGYTFERLCMYHLEQMRRSIGISAVQCETSAWFKRADELSKGAQIDLLIDRRDRVINICEMKFSVNEFIIDKEYDEILRNKLETFRSDSKTKKALQLTMVTTMGLKRNMYSNRVQSEVVLDDLFI